MMRLMIAEKEQLQDAVQLVMKLWPGHEEAEMLECVQEYMEHEEKTVLLAREEGLYWGICLVSLRHDYVEGTEGSPVGYLEGIYVEEEHRNLGTARALLMGAQQWAKKKGCREFASDCEVGNTESLAFHLACGFEEANRIICFVKEIE